MAINIVRLSDFFAATSKPENVVKTGTCKTCRYHVRKQAIT